MTTGKRVVTYFDSNGNPVDYRLLADRLPEFYKMFPLEKGYSVVIEPRPFEGLRKEFIPVYSAAAANGHAPDKVGLPSLSSRTIIFQAKLLDPENRVLLTASAMGEVIQYKDWEKLETAARQRLVAAAGLDGGVLVEDELRDIRDQGGELAQPNSTAPENAQPRPEPQPSETTDPAQPEPGASEESGAVVQPPPPQAEAKADSSAAAPEKTQQPKRNVMDGDRQFQALYRNLTHMCRLRQIEVPKVETIEDISKAMAELQRTASRPGAELG